MCHHHMKINRIRFIIEITLIVTKETMNHIMEYLIKKNVSNHKLKNTREPNSRLCVCSSHFPYHSNPHLLTTRTHTTGF